jgi:hypothetical protein
MRTLMGLLLASAIGAAPLLAQDQKTPQDQKSPGALDQVVAKIIARENQEMETVRKYSPLVETYIQRVSNSRAANQENWEPDGDRYFIGRANFSKGLNLEPIEARKDNPVRQTLADMNRFFEIGIEYLPKGFLQMIYPDADGLDTRNYNFQYVRREFLGEVRTLVFDITPTKKAGRGRFMGRIWVEDEAFTIVRFNGSYSGNADFSRKFHFESWRVNSGPNLWLPALIYSEQNAPKYLLTGAVWSKAQTRLWGYNIGRASEEQELSKVMIESQRPVVDNSQESTDRTPLQQERAWELQSQDNVMERLQREGLIAPKGEVDKILQTVENNLEVTNNLNFDPEIRCRVLLTSTMESFAIGRTIVLSRGLIDVLPDEASLAVMIAKELGHVIVGQKADTRFGFFDWMIRFDERKTFKHFDFDRSVDEDEKASAKASELLRNSPYKGQLQTAEMFLAELQKRAKEIPNLISPRLGGSILVRPSVAPDTEDKPGAKQIVAMPLGGRVKMDPWDDTLDMLKSKPLGDITERDKMPFEITPFFPYLTRVGGGPTKASEYRVRPQLEIGAQQASAD